MSADVFVYVIALRDGQEIKGPIKVGISSNPRARVASLQTACPFDLVLVREFRFPNREIALQFEDAFHTTQAKHRTRGEWFDLAPSYAIAIINLHVCWMLKHCMTLTPDEARTAIEMCGVDRELWELP